MAASPASPSIGEVQPVVVKAVIYDRQGRFLLQHRDNIAGIIEPDRWSLFGGGVEAGEALVEALERELQEELSCKVGVVEHELFRWLQAPENSLHVCFTVRFTAREQDLVLTEGQNLAWFSLAELKKLPLGALVRDNLHQLESFVAARKGFAAD